MNTLKLLAASLALVFAACGGADTAPPAAPAAETTPEDVGAPTDGTESPMAGDEDALDDAGDDVQDVESELEMDDTEIEDDVGDDDYGDDDYGDDDYGDDEL